MTKTIKIDDIELNMYPNCRFCDEELKMIKNGYRGSIKLTPDINPAGIFLGYHVNLDDIPEE